MKEAEEIIGGSSRWHRSDSFLASIVGRSQSSRLMLRTSSISAECAAMTKYERLSQSMRSPEQAPSLKHKAGVKSLLSHFFSRKLGEQAIGRVVSSSSKEEATKAKKKKRWSSWLPDPERRWPVQGW